MAIPDTLDCLCLAVFDCMSVEEAHRRDSVASLCSGMGLHL